MGRSLDVFGTEAVRAREKRVVYEDRYFIDPRGRRALFSQGRVVYEVWICDDSAVVEQQVTSDYALFHDTRG